MAPLLQIQSHCRLRARVEALYQVQDGADIGAEARKERQLHRRRGIAPAVDVVGHEGDLATELLQRLKQ
jgi:hypothetical protein